MAKRKAAQPKEESGWDDALEAAIGEAKKLFPGRVYTGSEESMRSICIPIPFGMRYALQQEGYPLGRFALLDGPKESCKSAFSYEIIRWHRRQQGKGVVIEVEDKRSPELCPSILEYDERAVEVHRCETHQEWQSALTFWVEKIRMLMDGDPKAPKARPGKGRIAPFAFVVDSIMAAVVEEVMKHVSEEGHADKRWALEAGQLSDYLKICTKWLSDFPFSLVGINHLKPGQDRYGNPTRNMPGGKAPGYHASLDVEMNPVGKQWKSAKEEGKTLRLSVMKNSSAPHAEIEVDMVWYIDYENPTEGGECLQRTFFDWGTAAIEVVRRVLAEPGTDRKRRLNDLLELHLTDKSKTCWSPVLGISQDSPLSYREAGVVLEDKIDSDKTFRDLLYPLVGIRRRTMYAPGTDFRDQMSVAQLASRDLQKYREKYIKEHGKVTGGPVTSIFDVSDETKSDASPLELG